MRKTGPLAESHANREIFIFFSMKLQVTSNPMLKSCLCVATVLVLLQVLNKRVPFVMNSVIDFKEHYSGSDKALEQLDYLAITAGLECIVDPKLKSALVTQCGEYLWRVGPVGGGGGGGLCAPTPHSTEVCSGHPMW